MTSNDAIQNVVNCYVSVVTKNRMKLDDVPDRYRERVKEGLKNVENNHDK